MSDINWDNHGPYPESWGDAERELWDREPFTVRDLYDADEWRNAQELFEEGWLNTVDPLLEDRYDAREAFYDLVGIDGRSFDWEAWREYMGYGATE